MNQDAITSDTAGRFPARQRKVSHIVSTSDKLLLDEFKKYIFEILGSDILNRKYSILFFNPKI